MRSFVILSLAVLFHLPTAHSQVTTAGGAGSGFFVLTEQLKLRDDACTKKSRLKKEDDLVQIYIKLSLYKQAASTEQECDEVKKYFQCLNTKELSSVVQEMRNDTFSIPLLKIRYDIEPEESKVIFDFFADLEKPAK
jgi:hypothetical protein